MNEKSGASKKIYLALFLAPLIVYAAAFMLGGLAPFGSGSLLPEEAWRNLTGSFSWYRQLFSGGNDMLYNFSLGLGDGQLSFWGFQFLSPLNLILFLIPSGAVLWGVWGVNGLRLSLSALFFYRCSEKIGKSIRLSFFGAALYSSAGILLALFWQTAWLDFLWILPVFIIGLFCSISENKCMVLGFFSFLIMLCCPLAGIYAVPFGILVLVIYGFKPDKQSALKLLKAFVSILAGLGLSAFNWLPLIVRAVKSGALTISLGIPAGFFTSSGAFLAFLGIPLVSSLALYFSYDKISLKEKLSAVTVLLFLIFSAFVKAELFKASIIANGFVTGILAGAVLLLIFLDTVSRQYKKAPLGIFCVLNLILSALFCVLEWNVMTLLQRILFPALAVIISALPIIMTMSKPALKGVFNGILALLVTANPIMLGVTGAFCAKPISVSFPGDFSSKHSAVEEIKKSDHTFFRMEISDKTVPDEARIYAYSGITGAGNPVLGGYVSVPALDSILGVKYVVAPKGERLSGYKEWFTADNQTAWVNPFVLPVGFLAKDNIVRASVSKDEPFTAVSRLYMAASGLQRRVFQPMSPVFIRGTAEEVPGGYNLQRTDAGEDAWVEFTYKAKADAKIYLYIPGADPEKLEILFDGKPVPFEDNWIIPLKDCKKYELITFRIKLKADAASIGAPQVVYENLGALQEYTVLLRTYSCELIRESASSLVGFADVPSGGRYMLTTIPYDPEWTVKVDGVKAENLEAAGGFLAVRLDEGVHTVTMRYFPAIYKAGIAVSAGTALILIFISWLKMRKKTASSKKQ